MSSLANDKFDAVVVGAGAGGLFAAARLAHRGYKTLVVEALDKVGGRASTDEIDGFKVNNGAIVIEVGGVTEETFAEVGAKFDIRQPSPPILYRIGGKNVDVTGGGWGLLLSKLTRQGAKLVSGLGAARNDSGLPGGEMSTADWVSKYTKNEGVHGIFRNMCASVFAVSSNELPARVFLTYFTRKSAFKKFGFHPEGTIGVWKALADSVESNGGEIWLSTTVESIETADGVITGVAVWREGVDTRIDTSVVISDVGPAATVGLVGEHALPAEYVEQVHDGDRPCSMIAVNFASRDRLIEAPGMLGLAKSQRLCYIGNFTETCPEMAPEGWNLYVGGAIPEPCVGEFDEKKEFALVLDDLRNEIPDFDNRARILSTNVTRDGWPPQRAVAGFDLPNTTPIKGLWNVGDGVKEYANGGTTACAETAKIVVDSVVDAFPLASI
ncbi:NAD(P)/FAD-dependent oxidoreductase [Rhodococcus erythropolis]